MEKRFYQKNQKQGAGEPLPRTEIQKKEEPVKKIGSSFENVLKIVNAKTEILKSKQEIKDINQLEHELNNIFQELQTTLSRLEHKHKLTQEQINDEIVNIPAQTFRLNEIIKNNFIDKFQASEEFEPIFNAKEVGEIISRVSDINSVIDNLDIPRFQNKYEFSELVKSVQQSIRPIGYGRFAHGLAEKLKEKLSGAQENFLDLIKRKINIKKFQGFIDKLQKSSVIPKTAYGATLFTMGFLFVNPFEELGAQVNVKGGDSLELDVNGLEIKNIRLSELNNYLTTEEISGDINDVYNLEIKFKGVNYDIEDQESYNEFIKSEMDRIIADIEKIIGEDIDKANMKPDAWTIISARIVEDNLEYADLLNEEQDGVATQAAAEEREKINSMPLDKLLMDHGKGVCRHYAAAIESISDNIKEITDSPYLKNIKIEELAIDVVGRSGGHGTNIIMAKINEQGKDKLITNYIDATWDDDGKFIDDLEIIPGEEERRETNTSFIRVLTEHRDLFSLEDQVKIYEYIAENYTQFSAERTFADQYLVDFYYKEAINNELDIDEREQAFKNMKKFILDQGYIRKTGELCRIFDYRFYLTNYDSFKNTEIGDDESRLDVISEYNQAVDYIDEQNGHKYYYRMGQLFEDIDSGKAEEHYLKCVDSLDKVDYDSIGFSNLYNSTERLKQIYEDQGAPEKILDVYLEILDHDISDHGIYNFIQESLDYSNEHGGALSDEQKQDLIKAAERLSDTELRQKYINQIGAR